MKGPLRGLVPAGPVALLAAGTLSLLAPESLAAQEPGGGPPPSDLPGLAGVVTDVESRAPLEGATVRLRSDGDTTAGPGASRVAVSDSSGRFTLGRLPDGRYRIEVARAGYRTLADSVDFRAALGLRLRIALVPEAVALEPLLVAVEARSRRLAASGFYERLERGVGQFVTREEIDERDPRRVSDLLATLAGVRLLRRGGPEGTVVVLRGGCAPQVFLDGVRQIGPFSVDGSLHPDDVAGIELYRGLEVPPRFGVSGCGALVIWTRVPQAEAGGQPLPWGAILVPLGVLGAAALLFL